MPLIFLGHGSPMNAIEKNIYTDSWREIGKNMKEKPRAILMLSAHWMTAGETRINTIEKPEMIYDMYWFPHELYEIRYDVSGSEEIAREIIGMMGDEYPIIGDPIHGLDHGAWSTLIHVFPDTDIPVIQMSLDYSRSPNWHYEFGNKLKKLREQGILIIGSGNIVHNLRTIDWSNKEKYSWAIEFDSRIARDIEIANYSDICDFQNRGEISHLAHPTHDHILPLFPLLGAIDISDSLTFLTPEISMGSISMRSILWR
jgi:4,5-DOPA dioxygenase extradiol